MPKPSEIFDTPSATGFSRVGGNEEIDVIAEGLRTASDGIEFTHYKQRLINLIATKDQEKEEAIRAETHATLTWVNIILGYKHPLEVRQLIEQKLVDLEALPTEDNKNHLISVEELGK